MYLRIKVNLLNPNISAKLPFDYKYLMYSALLKVVGGKYSEEIHENRIKRAWLFSNLIFNHKVKPIDSKSRYFTVPRFCHFYITSRDGKLLHRIVSKLVKMNSIYIDKTTFILREVNLERIDLSDTNEYTLLSPVVVRDKEGKAHEVSKKEELEELINKYVERIATRLEMSELKEIRVKVKTEKLRKKVYSIKGFPIVAYETTNPGGIIIEGPTSAKTALCYLGLGDRTNIGFGMIGPHYGGKK